jgi:hypothetical protein
MYTLTYGEEKNKVKNKNFKFLRNKIAELKKKKGEDLEWVLHNEGGIKLDGSDENK